MRTRPFKPAQFRYEEHQAFEGVKHKVVPNKLLEKARPSEERFLDGTLAMFLNSRRGVPTYRDIKDFDWDVAPLPRGKEQAGVLHTDAFFMAAAR